MRAAGLMLGLEGLGFLLLLGYTLPGYLEVGGGGLFFEILNQLLRPILFGLLGLFALLVSFSFLRLRPGAWLQAMLVQGLNLLLALSLYFSGEQHPFYIYLMMIYGIVMVVYLHYHDVQAAFRRLEAPEFPGGTE